MDPTAVTANPLKQVRWTEWGTPVRFNARRGVNGMSQPLVWGVRWHTRGPRVALRNLGYVVKSSVQQTLGDRLMVGQRSLEP